MRVMAEQALASRKGWMLCQGLVDERLFDGRQRSAFVVDLVLVMATETQPGHCFDQVIIDVRAMWIVASNTTPLSNGAMHNLGAVRNDIDVATDTQSFRGKLQLSSVLRFVRAVTESTKTLLSRLMFVIMLRQTGVTVDTQFAAACRVPEFVFWGIDDDMTCIA